MACYCRPNYFSKIAPAVCLSMSTYLPTYVSIHLSTCLSVHLSIYLSFNQSIIQTIYYPSNLFIDLSVYLFWRWTRWNRTFSQLGLTITEKHTNRLSLKLNLIIFVRLFDKFFIELIYDWNDGLSLVYPQGFIQTLTDLRLPEVKTQS